jgi:hypothetical protein
VLAVPQSQAVSGRLTETTGDSNGLVGLGSATSYTEFVVTVDLLEDVHLHAYGRKVLAACTDLPLREFLFYLSILLPNPRLVGPS